MARALLFGPFRLDLLAKELRRDGEPVALAPKTLDLLILLAEHAGQVLTREQLFEALWPGVFVGDHALSVQVFDVRKALGEDMRKPRYVITRRRRGYCFAQDVIREGGTGSPPASTMAPAIPETQYACNRGVNIAYQVAGDGPLDLVFVMGWVSHLEYGWTEPRFARFLRRLSSFRA